MILTRLLNWLRCQPTKAHEFAAFRKIMQKYDCPLTDFSDLELEVALNRLRRDLAIGGLSSAETARVCINMIQVGPTLSTKEALEAADVARSTSRALLRHLTEISK